MAIVKSRDDNELNKFVESTTVTGLPAVAVVNPDGTDVSAGGEFAIKVTVSGDVTYVGKAIVGTAQATAKWQAQKIDETSGTVITWADGDADFNNLATDLTALSYS